MKGRAILAVPILAAAGVAAALAVASASPSASAAFPYPTTVETITVLLSTSPSTSATTTEPVSTQPPTTTSEGPAVTTVPVGESCTYRGATATTNLPDPACTPGALNPDVTQATIATTICKTGWTSTIRPPVSYTEPLKYALLKAYGQPADPAKYELDHLVPLELGGAPSDVRNLWPEIGPTPNPKDSVENALRRDVCSGTMTLARAQAEILVWTTARP